MEFTIYDKKRKELFISIFQLLKSCSSQINLIINKQKLHIQGIDKSHVCLFNLELQYEWFDSFHVNKKHELSIDASIFHSIISTKSENQSLVFRLEEDEADSLLIKIISDEDNKGDYNKYFTIPLIDFEYEQMIIPKTDYDAEFTLPSKKVTDIISQLSNFGDSINIKCSQYNIDFTTKGDIGEMRVNIPADDLSSFAIIENEVINLSYSLNYINKMCISNKLSSDIEFSLSNDIPLKIHYNLGEESSLSFYIAPKVAD